jgi:transposase
MEPVSLVAQKLTDVVLSERIIEPDKLKKRFESVLVIWHNATTRRKNYEKPISETKEARLKIMVDRKVNEANFWKAKLRLHGIDESIIKTYYSELDSLLDAQGLL